MFERTAYCGLDCLDCPAYKAARSGNPADVEKVIEMWGSPDFPLNAEDIYCDGCKQDNGRLFKFCSQCAIRKCAASKQLHTCAECPQYPCAQLEQHLKMIPEVKDTLDKLHSQAE